MLLLVAMDVYASTNSNYYYWNMIYVLSVVFRQIGVLKAQFLGIFRGNFIRCVWSHLVKIFLEMLLVFVFFCCCFFFFNYLSLKKDLLKCRFGNLNNWPVPLNG